MRITAKRFGFLVRALGWIGLVVLFISIAADIQAAVIAGVVMIVVSLALISFSYFGLFRSR